MRKIGVSKRVHLEKRAKRVSLGRKRGKNGSKRRIFAHGKKIEKKQDVKKRRKRGEFEADSLYFFCLRAKN